MAKLYTLSDSELAIIRRAETTKNPNWFTDFFLQGENTGTWWKPGAESERWRKGYEALHTFWRSKGKPDNFVYGRAGQERPYRVVFTAHETEPSFHDHHGFLFQPWQLDLHNALQRIRWVISGFGSGKTVGEVASQLTDAATLPGFRGLVLAPNSTMTNEAFTQALRLMSGTRYGERFLIRATERPFPKITIGNSLVGKTTIQFFPIGDAVGIKKILTLTIDRCMIDQAEQLSNFEEIVRAVGSRMRGQYKGRAVKGVITFLANAYPNAEMWDEYDKAETDPDRYYSISPRTWDNPYITDEQIRQIKKDVGGDAESIRVFMEGGRPNIGGEHFNQDTLNRCKSPLLDEIMQQALASKEQGVVYSKNDRLGVWEWCLPPRPGRKYLVVADPGYDNPPRRNSACVMIFDYTDFPDKPAQLWGFFWVFGNNSPWPWIDIYVDSVKRYNSYFSNAIDNTGGQTYYDRIIPELQDVNVYGIGLTRSVKMGLLNVAKSMASKGLFAFPSIPRLFSQLSQYKLPDENLPQDLVMTLLIAAGWLESVFYTTTSDAQVRSNYNPVDRHFRDHSGIAQGASRYYRENRR